MGGEPRKLKFPSEVRGSLLYTTGQKVRLYDAKRERWIKARIRGKVRRRNGWYYALKANHKKLRCHVSSKYIRAIKSYDILKDKLVMELVGNARRFKECFGCTADEYKVAKETWRKHQQEEADAMEDLLAEALGPLGASEASLQSFKKYLKKNDVLLDDLEGVKKLRDIDGCAHAHKKHRSYSMPHRSTISGRRPSTSRAASRSRAYTTSKRGKNWGRMNSVRSTIRRNSRTPSRVWPPRKDITASRLSVGRGRSRSCAGSRSRRTSLCPSRVWPPTKKSKSLTRRNTEPSMSNRKFMRAVSAVIAGVKLR